MNEYIKDYGHLLTVFLIVVIILRITFQLYWNIGASKNSRFITELWWAKLSKEQKLFEIEHLDSKMTREELNELRKAKGYIPKPRKAHDL